MTAVRIIVFVMILQLWLGGTAAAFACLDAAEVAAALDYGNQGAQLPLTDFLKPWIVYEERTTRMTVATEQATVYTPFLLVAADARDRAQDGGFATQADAEKVLNDYGAYVVFGVTLTGRDPGFAARVSASLRQGRHKAQPHLLIAPPVAELAPGLWRGRAFYRAQVFAYFLVKDVTGAGDATLSVRAADGRRRSFAFAFDSYR